MRKKRLDALLVERRLADSIEAAGALVGAGRVEVNGQRADKVGSTFDPECRIEIREKQPYVGRGGEKLAAGLDYFGIDPTGMICADIGCSTGGFTDCLLQKGARRVYAVDVGYGVLDWQLRQDDRVVVLERTNARYLTREHIPELLDLAVIDASFISLAKVLPATLALLADAAEVVALVKPQFEVGRGQVGKGGIVRDPGQHAAAVEQVRAAAEALGCTVLGVTESPLLGQKGNREFLIHLHKGVVG